MVGRRSEARGIPDGAIDVRDGPAGPADHVVVVVADPRLVSGDRSRGLDAPHQAGVGQSGKDVVDGLPRHLGKTNPNGTEDGVGIGMGMGVHRVEYRDPRPRHPQVGVSQLLSEFRRGRHSEILSRFLD